MTKLLIALTLALGLSGVAAAADKPATAQQEKMGNCNKEAKAKNMAGDERKKFMSACLKGKADEPKAEEAKKGPLDPKDAMGACNKAATGKELKGDDRKKFMSACLKAKGPDQMAK